MATGDKVLEPQSPKVKAWRYGLPSEEGEDTRDVTEDTGLSKLEVACWPASELHCCLEAMHNDGDEYYPPDTPRERLYARTKAHGSCSDIRASNDGIRAPPGRLL